MVRGKFYVKAKSEYPMFGLHPHETKIITKVELSAIWAGADASGKNKATENHVFSEASPSADIVMQIANKDAADKFVTGGQYYVDFTPAS